MIILGTPGVSLNFGIPDWLLALIIAGLILLYYSIRKLIGYYKQRAAERQLSEHTHGEEMLPPEEDAPSDEESS